MKKTITYLALLIGTMTYAQLESIHTTYEYDTLNRLVEVVFDNGTTVEYSYDNLGNRQAKQIELPGMTYVPDDAFEQELINLGFDNVLDDFVLTDNIDDIVTFSLFNLGVEDLTGIEDFSELNFFTASFNQITQADLSQNNNLSILLLDNNLLSSIELGNIELAELIIDNNELMNFDASPHPTLLQLRINDNNLMSLNVNNLPNLSVLHLHNNPINELDLQGTTSISWISTFNTQLEELDLSDQTSLLTVHTWESNLHLLNLHNGFNQNLGIMNAENNPNLFCIQVDDENAANSGSGVYANWIVDNQVSYSEDCMYLGVTDFDILGDLLIIPNPVSDFLEVILPENFPSNTFLLEVFDIHGRLLIEQNMSYRESHVKIPVRSLQNGMYYVKITADTKSWSQQFVKK